MESNGLAASTAIALRNVVLLEVHRAIFAVTGAAEQVAMLQPVLAAGIPIANTSRAQPQEYMSVVLGDAEEFYDHVYDVFHELGIDRICQVAFGEKRGHFSTQWRYEQYTKQHDLPFHSYWLPEPDVLEKVHELTEVDPDFANWLRKLPKPAGIFTQNHFAGGYLCRACELLELHVPDEVAIIGSDDFDVATSTRPHVTSLRSPAIEVGAKAAEVAIEMAKPQSSQGRLVLVRGMTLIRRASTGEDMNDFCDIDAALKFIDRHACDAVTVHDVIANTQSVSRVTFHKHFVNQTGLTPSTAILQRRLREARWLLTQTDMSPGAIAGLCGYTNYLHFYRVFRKAEGVSPSTFRKLAT